MQRQAKIMGRCLFRVCVQVNGCIELEDFAVVSATGPDAKSFLQGYLTCDLDELSASRALVGALCNLQGRVVTDLVVVDHDHRLLLCMHASVTGAFIDALKKYLVFSKTRLDTEPDWAVLGAFEAHGAPLAARHTHGGVGVTLPDGSRELLLVPLAHLGDIAVDRHDDTALDAWVAADVAARWVHVTDTLSGKFLPQMLGYVELGAISFAKGCYLGQEIVARAQHRGEVKRRLRQVSWSGPAPRVGEAITDSAGNAIATVVAVAGGPTGTALTVCIKHDGAPGRTTNGTVVTF